MKHLLGKVLASRLKDGQVIGVGSGTTVEAAFPELQSRISKERLTVFGVATSYFAARLAEDAGFRILDSSNSTDLAWAFDGADEVDNAGNLIKGRGAAMLQEKIVARRAGGITVLVTPEKLVSKLGSKMPVPVEVVPSARFAVEAELKKLGSTSVSLRMSQGKFGPVFTETNNIILDALFADAAGLESAIKLVPGVVESGIFVGLTNEILIARDDGIYSRKAKGEEVRVLPE